LLSCDTLDVSNYCTSGEPVKVVVCVVFGTAGRQEGGRRLMINASVCLLVNVPPHVQQHWRKAWRQFFHSCFVLSIRSHCRAPPKPWFINQWGLTNDCEAFLPLVLHLNVLSMSGIAGIFLKLASQKRWRSARVVQWSLSRVSVTIWGMPGMPLIS